RATRRRWLPDALVHQQHEPVEDGQQDIFLGRKIICQLAATHPGLFFNLGEGQVLKSTLRDDGNGRLHDLLAADGGNVDALASHALSSGTPDTTATVPGPGLLGRSFGLLSTKSPKCLRESAARPNKPLLD